jgi:transcriptional regulator with XRE-family HTH domain
MNLADLRLAQHQTQLALSELSGVTVETISHIERGKHPPRLETMLKIAKALGVELADIDEFTMRITI